MINMTRGSLDENGTEEPEEILPLRMTSSSPSPSPLVEVAKEPAKPVGVGEIGNGLKILEPEPSLSLSIVKKAEEKDVKPKPKSALDGLRFLLNQCKLGSIKLPSTVVTNGDEDSNKLTGESGKVFGSDPDNGQDNNPINGGHSTPKITRKRKSRSSCNCTESTEGADVEPLPGGRRVTRHSLSKLRKSDSPGDKVSQKELGSRRVSMTASTPPASKRSVPIPIKLKDCSIKLYHCDYKLRVNSQFNYRQKPSLADERNLIKSLQKLKRVIQTRLEEKAKAGQSIVKRGSLRSFMPTQTVSSLITPAPTPPPSKNKLKTKKKNKFSQKKKCRDCPKTFASQFQLQRHVLKWHYGRKRPFPCELCEKAFYQRGHLYDHLRMHMGETPYKCGVCQKAFHQNGQLVIHMRSHSTAAGSGAGTEMGAEAESGVGEIKKVAHSYSCTKCNKTFANYIQRKRHFKNHHLARRLLYRCSICGKCCSSIRLLKIHSRTGHWPDEIKMMRG